MSRRYFKGHPLNDASDIASEVVLTGKSEGWCGDLEDLEEVKKVLRPFNIVYTDDMRGTWEHST